MKTYKTTSRLLKSINGAISEYKKGNLQTYKNANELFKSLGI